jgi:hypothetical protein
MRSSSFRIDSPEDATLASHAVTDRSPVRRVPAHESSSRSMPAPPASGRSPSTRRVLRRVVVPGVHPALPPSRAGSSTIPRRSGRRAGHARRAGARARPTGRRGRDHRPARDRRRVGPRTGTPRHRAIVWQDRRTAGRLRALEAAGQLALVRVPPGWCSTRTSRRPSASGSSPGWGGRRPRPRWSARRLVAHLEAHRVARSMPPTRPTPAAPCCSTSDVSSGPTSSSSCSTCPRHALPEVCPEQRPVRLTADTTALGAGIPISGVAGDQQAALFGQACVSGRA